MSKETIRKAIEGRFSAFTGLTFDRKSYQNASEPKNKANGMWAHIEIVHVMREITSMGSTPCTTRTGTVVIKVYSYPGLGSSTLGKLTDDLEEWFSFYETGNLWLDAAITIDVGESKQTYQSVVYIPYTYSD